MEHNQASQPVATEKAPAIVPGYAWFMLTLLTAINLINYVDRQIVPSVGADIQADLRLNDAWLGAIMGSFIISYTVLSPIFGRLGDVGERRRLIAIGIVIWSVATVMGGLARSGLQLLIARTLVGIGEASYATIAPSLIADVFPKNRRGTALGIFFAAIPLGLGLGVSLGALAPWFEHHWKFGKNQGWQPTLFLVGGPGLLLAALYYLFTKEPKRGGMDEMGPAEKQSQDAVSSGPVPLRARIKRSVIVYAALLTIPTFLFATLGYTALTFATGGLINWAEKFLEKDKHPPPDDPANNPVESDSGEGEENHQPDFREQTRMIFGLIVIAAGFIGTLLGGALSDWLLRYTKYSYFLVCGVTVLLAVVPTLLVIGVMEPTWYFAFIFAAVLFLVMGNAPVNALIINSVAPNLRASAVALSILIIHVFGDVLSNWAIGALSVAIKESAQANSLPGFVASIARLFSLDPGFQHLSIALLITPVAMIVSGIFFLIGMRTVR